MSAATSDARPNGPQDTPPDYSVDQGAGDALRTGTDGNPYLPTVRDNNDLAETLKTTNTRLWYALLACLVIILGLAMGVSVVGHRQPQNSALVIDKTVGSWKIVQLPNVATTPDIQNQLAQFFLPVVVESQFTVTDVDGDKRNLVEFVRPFLDVPSQAATFFNAYLKQHDPAELGKRVRVTVEVDPVPGPKKQDEYVVGWTEITRSLEGAELGRVRRVADITIHWGAATTQNPGGLYIETFSLLDVGPVSTVPSP